MRVVNQVQTIILLLFLFNCLILFHILSAFWSWHYKFVSTLEQILELRDLSFFFFPSFFVVLFLSLMFLFLVVTISVWQGSRRAR